MSDSRPVPPSAVRVWRGFRASTLAQPDFLSKLGTVFIPATVKLQIENGLCAYLPTIPGGLADKPAAVPDETAILFWESQQTYWDAFGTLATRTYTLTHGGVYQAPVSQAGFPTPFAGSVAADQPVLLFDHPADWMHGAVTHLVAAAPTGMSDADFFAAVAAALGKVQALTGIDGAIACVGAGYLVYWELVTHVPGGQKAPSGVPILQAVCGWNSTFQPAPTFLPIGIYEPWSGMNVTAGSSFNMQFTRRTAG